MPHLQCPNIKNDILNLRSKLGELKKLKTDLLSNDPAYQENFEHIQAEIGELIIRIDKTIDLVANIVLIPKIKEANIFELLGLCSQGRVWVKNQDGYAHVDLHCRYIYTEVYHSVDSYSFDRAKVWSKNGNEEFHVDLAGEPVYPERYYHVESYREGRAVVQTQNEGCFHIDINGIPIYKERYVSIGNYVNGQAWVETEDGYNFQIDLDGNRIVEEE